MTKTTKGGWTGLRKSEFFRRPGRFLSGNRVLAVIAAWIAIGYLKLTYATQRWVVEPEDPRKAAEPLLPAIAAVWHGQHVLLPAIPIGIKGSVMISRSLDGEITAIVAEAFGARAIRASGGRNRRSALEKGGIRGFLEMLDALGSGESVMQTADVPKGVPRRAGLGIVMLAKRSGRPVVPLAVASSRRWVVKGAWDRTTFNLPFGRSALVVGNPVNVPADADDAALEAARAALEAELNRITARAYELTGRPE